MADRSNYADRPIAEDSQGALPEHRDRFSEEARAYTPFEGESEEGTFGTAGIRAGSDPLFKSARFYRNDRGYIFDTSEIAQMYAAGYVPGQNPVCTSLRYRRHLVMLEAQMPTYRPSANPSELEANARHLRGEPGAIRYDNSACGTTLALAA